MRLDEILFESDIQKYSEKFKEILRTSRRQATDAHNAWLVAKQTNPTELHPLEQQLNVKLVWSDDNN